MRKKGEQSLLEESVSTSVEKKKGGQAVRLHLTNIVGLGAAGLLQSLLPEMLGQREFKIEKLYLPTIGPLATFKDELSSDRVVLYKRYLPNAISRLLECTILGGYFNGDTPLLVFGDLPLRCNSQQTVFVQTSLLIPGENSGRRLGVIKYWIARWIFRHNQRFVTNFIVQTVEMRDALSESYPEITDRLHVIAQPAPSWLIASRLKRTRFFHNNKLGLHLFYPAAPYPHKNHKILGEITQFTSWPISELVLTVAADLNPNKAIPWLKCVGQLKPEAMIDVYRTTDALLFLSLSESFGFPIIEAMWIGLPIICPDLPYARTLCGDKAIYFDPRNVESLQAAINELYKRYDSGWWPDWSENLKKIPLGWGEVAEEMLKIANLGNSKIHGSKL